MLTIHENVSNLKLVAATNLVDEIADEVLDRLVIGSS